MTQRRRLVKVLAEVSLRIGGIMSAEPYEDLLEDVETANAAARSLGCPLPHPFFTMAQTVLLSLPEVGLTDRGVVDVAWGKSEPPLIPLNNHPLPLYTTFYHLYVYSNTELGK